MHGDEREILKDDDGRLRIKHVPKHASGAGLRMRRLRECVRSIKDVFFASASYAARAD